MKRLLRPLIIAALVGIAAFGAASLSSDNPNENTNTNETETVSVDGGQEAEPTEEGEPAETSEEAPADNESERSDETEAEPETTESTESDSEDSSDYSYTAQSGDSYSKVARKAVQTYGINNNVELSQAQIVAAETFLTSDAGFPALNLGEEVSLNSQAVEAAVNKAKDLDEAAKVRWERYVPGVNFNTDKVGQA